MARTKQGIGTVDHYIASFPPDVREKLVRIRAIILRAAPNAEEKISYGIPGYKLNGVLVYFAAFKTHYSLFFATKTVLDVFRKDLAAYSVSRGTVRFPAGKRLPIGLIGKIVRFRVRENLKAGSGKKTG